LNKGKLAPSKGRLDYLSAYASAFVLVPLYRCPCISSLVLVFFCWCPCAKLDGFLFPFANYHCDDL
jgi:hypothetical protein